MTSRVTLSLAFTAFTLLADVIDPVPSRTQLKPNDFVDWASLGPDLAILTNTFTTSSAAGLTVTGSMTGARFMRLTSGTSFQGSLPETGGVLFNGSLFGPPTYEGLPVTIEFGSPVVGFGFDIQNGFFGPFTVTIEAFHQGGLLGALTFQGVSGPPGSPGVPFVGVRATSALIDRIVISTSVSQTQQIGASNFAIDRMDLLLTPEPTYTGTCAIALVFVAFVARNPRVLRR